MVRFAAVEGGGTTWVVAICEESFDLQKFTITERAEFQTESPAKTIGQIRSWLLDRNFDALGVATFGPIDANLKSSKFGHITSTPKPGWTDTDVLQLLGAYQFQRLGIPFKFDTDVNAPALAEYLLQSKPGTSSSAYITVGTGVGVGLVVNGRTIHGLLHPEAGHIQVARKENDNFKGTCPFHKSCIEGMCSSGALAARKGIAPTELANLADDDDVWDQCAYQLAQLCAQLILIVSPERIAFGGGVMNRKCLYPKIRKYVQSILNDYIRKEEITTNDIDSLICPSFWGNNAGIIGAAFLAKLAYDESRRKENQSLELPKTTVISSVISQPDKRSWVVLSLATGIAIGYALHAAFQTRK